MQSHVSARPNLEVWQSFLSGLIQWNLFTSLQLLTTKNKLAPLMSWCVTLEYRSPQNINTRLRLLGPPSRKICWCCFKFTQKMCFRGICHFFNLFCVKKVKKYWQINQIWSQPVVPKVRVGTLQRTEILISGSQNAFQNKKLFKTVYFIHYCENINKTKLNLI